MCPLAGVGGMGGLGVPSAPGTEPVSPTFQGVGVGALQTDMNPSNEKLTDEPHTKIQISHCTV